MTSSNKPTLTLTAGCGGSGKSTVMARMFPGLPVVDMDAIKETLPGYDPLHPERVHDESARLAMREFYARLGSGVDFAFDGTGKNVEKYINLINAAHSVGYRVRIVHVRAPLATCLARNAARPRKVPAAAIVEAFNAVEAAQAVLKHYVDEHVVVDNA